MHGSCLPDAQGKSACIPVHSSSNITLPKVLVQRNLCKKVLKGRCTNSMCQCTPITQTMERQRRRTKNNTNLVYERPCLKIKQKPTRDRNDKPFPSRGGAPFALKLSTCAFVSVSRVILICISDLNLVYLLLSNWYHLGA